MPDRIAENGKLSTSVPVDVESLYYEFLKCFYGRNQRQKAQLLVGQIESVLATDPHFAFSVRGEEVRSLLAELRGDWNEAIACREAEIRKLYEVHFTTWNTPYWDFVARLYDPSDISDRLDLLAILYDQRGDKNRAIEILNESKDYCKSHKIRFDGQDLLDDLTGESSSRKPRKRRQAVANR